ncbi:MAG: MFS transporter, partial [Acidimicrobiales bacterium]
MSDRQPGFDHDDFTLGAAGGDEVVVVPWPLLIRDRMARKVTSSNRYRWWVLWTVLAGLFSIDVTFTVFVVALPRVAQQFHTSEATLTWVVTGPLLSFGIAAPLLGKAGDLWGHRRLYLLGLLGGVVCAALSAAAPNATTLIAARTLEGLEGAATGAASMALILRVFDKGDRVKAMGFWSLVGAGGPVIGVVLGAPIIQAFGWRWLFLGQIPFSLSALVLAALILPRRAHDLRDSAQDGDPDAIEEVAAARSRKLDWPGVAWVTVAVAAMLFGLNRGPVLGWSSPAVLIALALSPIAMVCF